MAKSVGQDELRKMMQKVKAAKPSSSSNSTRLKKYKLSARELQLIEEQKKREAQEKKPVKPKTVQPLPSSSARPVKSILKNSGAASPYVQAPVIANQVPKVVESGEKRKAGFVESSSSGQKKSRVEPEAEEEEGGDKVIPEGFFDDPKLDAKVRNIEYKDPKDEEWDKFQKEINQEIDTAQEIVNEEQEESTLERQIEEVDEQIRAWSKVNQMEKKLDEIEKTLSEKKKQAAEVTNNDSADEDSDEEPDESLDWRKKC